MKVRVAVSLLLLLLSACAAEVVRSPARLDVSPSAGARVYLLKQALAYRLDSGYRREIPEGTEFTQIGAVSQGRVLKPTRTVVTVEGAHMHEAYLVVSQDQLVGFYLPVEQAFSPLSNAVRVSFQ